VPIALAVRSAYDETATRCFAGEAGEESRVPRDSAGEGGLAGSEPDVIVSTVMTGDGYFLGIRCTRRDDATCYTAESRFVGHRKKLLGPYPLSLGFHVYFDFVQRDPRRGQPLATCLGFHFSLSMAEGASFVIPLSD